MILSKGNFIQELEERGALVDLSLRLTEKFEDECITIDIDRLKFRDKYEDENLLVNISGCSNINDVIVDKVYEEHNFGDDILEAFVECRGIKIEKLYFEDSWIDCELEEDEHGNEFLFNKMEYTTNCKYAIVILTMGNVVGGEIVFHVDRVFVYDTTQDN